MSLLFFAGDRVYKVKQELDLGFIDASTLAKRRHLCEEEVRLNAKLAPGVHLGVVPIARAPDGHLVVGAGGEPVEWAVEMIRLPAELMLARLLERGVVDNAQMNALAELLSAFHRDADAGPDVAELGTPESVAPSIEENFAQLAPFVAPAGRGAPGGMRVLTPDQHGFLRARARGFLRDRRELLARRARSGFVRDGHGDLHAENICQLPQGFVLYDRIEFNRRLRCLDVANDLAFLVMDLDARGFPGFGAYLARRYADLTGDPELLSLLAFYKAYRALVRAKVAALSAGAATPAEREELRRAAARYVQLAVGYELPAVLVMVGGLPGSGKTFLSTRLARPLRAPVFHSDERRKRLAGLAAGTSARAGWGQGLYTDSARARTYRSLLADAVGALRSNRSAIVDASFARREFRRPFVDAAARLGVPYCFLELDAPEDLVRRRLAARGEGSTSDADFEIFLEERAAYEPPEEVPGGHVVRVAAGVEAPEDSLAPLFDRLVALVSAD